MKVEFEGTFRKNNIIVYFIDIARNLITKRDR